MYSSKPSELCLKSRDKEQKTSLSLKNSESSTFLENGRNINTLATMWNGPNKVGTGDQSVGSGTPQQDSASKTRLSTSAVSRRESSALLRSRTARRQRKKDIEAKFGRKASGMNQLPSDTVRRQRCCRWTFIFDPAGRFMYWWTAVISSAFLYNFWVIIYRYAFDEVTKDNLILWFSLDYSFDLIYIVDIALSFRTGYLEEGVLQTDSRRMRIHYMNSTKFYIDCLCMLPLDFLYLSIGFKSMVRVFRLVKIYKFWQFSDRTERHTNYPNTMRSLKLLHYLLAIVHWNACIFKMVSDAVQSADVHAHSLTPMDSGVGPDTWRIPQFNTTGERYLYALYWSMLTLTLMGDLPKPVSVGAYVFVIFEVMFGLLLFATVLGHVGNIVTNVSAARKDFQARLDSVKGYMALRRVPRELQSKVIKWFDYLWSSNKISDEEKVLNSLPDKLNAEIAIHVHLDTLKRVEIFQNTEEGFLSELVLRLKPVLFSPGDYICRKGEVGKEMYVVTRGRLHVVAEDGVQVLATLRPGGYFGEISILNMGTAGNRRTASVKSVGYSDLFCLSKTDLWDVLKEYPAARVNLEAMASRRLAAYKKTPSQTAAISRCKSTPGLVESSSDLGQSNKTRRSPRSGFQPPHQHQALCKSCIEMTGSQTNITSPDNSVRIITEKSQPPTSQVSTRHPPPNSLLSPSTAAQPHVLPTHSSTLPVISIDRPSSPTPICSPIYPLQPQLGTSASSLISMRDPCTDILVQEVSRLRQRVLTLETENTGLQLRLNQHQWSLEARIAELEMRKHFESSPMHDEDSELRFLGDDSSLSDGHEDQIELHDNVDINICEAVI